MNTRRSLRREVAREQRDRGEKQRHDAVRRDVSRVDPEDKRGHEPGEKEGCRDAEHDAESRQFQPIADWPDCCLAAAREVFCGSSSL